MVAGAKTFHLLPPCDAYRMALTTLPAASFQPDGAGRLVPVLEGGGSGGGGAAGASSSSGARRVAWSPIDPNPPDPAAAAAAYPLFFDPALPRPLVAEIRPGDVLYLPSLWWAGPPGRPAAGARLVCAWQQPARRRPTLHRGASSLPAPTRPQVPLRRAARRPGARRLCGCGQRLV